MDMYMYIYIYMHIHYAYVYLYVYAYVYILHLKQICKVSSLSKQTKHPRYEAMHASMRLSPSAS